MMILPWLLVYGYTGYLAGIGIGHPVLGALLGLLVGLYPSAQMSVAAHYGGNFAFLAIPAIIILPILSTSPRTQLAVGSGVCAVPWLLLLLHVVRTTKTARQNGRKRMEM